MNEILNDVIPLFERKYKVRVWYCCSLRNMSYEIRMMGNGRIINYILSDHSYPTHDEIYKILLSLYYKLLNQEIKHPEPEKPDPKETPPPTNCPNCGAVVTSRQCEYCGTMHWGFDEVVEETDGNSAFGVSMDEAVANLNAFTRAAIMTPNEVREVLGVPGMSWGVRKPQSPSAIMASFNSLENAKSWAQKYEANKPITIELKKPKKKIFKRRKK